MTGCGDDGGASTTSASTGDAGTTTDTPTTDEPTTATTGTDEPTTTTTTATTGEPDPTTTGGDTSGSDTSTGDPAAEPEIVHEFDVAMFQLPEGLDVYEGTAYVGLVTGQVFTVDPEDGTTAMFGGLVGLPQDNTAIMTGLIVGPDGAVYVALDVFAPGDFVSGIYKIPAGGGLGVPFASDPAMAFPNGFAFDAKGDLLVTDSFTATIFHVAIADGTVTPWVQDPLLAPNPDTCKLDSAFHLGANGITRAGDRVFVTNSDQASILEIPVDAMGKAGAPKLLLGPDCEALSGADGLIVEPNTDNLLVPVNYKQRIIRVDATQQITVLAEGGLLQSPATLVMAPAGDAVLIANAAFETATTDPANAHPALLSLGLQ
ncbi:MAG TPA: hypothetical protein VGB85_01215 [Nannocystis sp.]|jgi:hypothetical protein